MRKFRLSPDGPGGGVSGGLAYWIGIPSWIIRAIFILATIFYGYGVLIYVILYFVVPGWNKLPEDYDEVTGD